MLVIMLAALALGSGQDVGGPSFDCTEAMTSVENEICTNPDLARLDVRIADRYAALRRSFGPAARSALQQDQRYFVAMRDEVYQSSQENPAFTSRTLAEIMESRAEFLDALDETPSDNPVGVWANLEGGGTINSGVHGGWVAYLNTVQPLNARWVCEFQGVATGSASVLTFMPEDSGGSPLTARIENGLLFIEDQGNDTGTSSNCGASGSLSGAYFRATRKPWE